MLHAAFVLAQANDEAEALVAIIGLVCVGLLGFIGYFLPSVIAAIRGHHNAVAIIVLNLLLGWTLIGWVVALVWAFTAVERRYY
jgi:hypothetical protein